MGLLREIKIWATVISVLIVAGCSGGGDPVMPEGGPMGGDQPLNNTGQPDDPLNPDTPASDLPGGRQLWGMWNVTYNSGTLSTKIEPVQDIELLFDGVDPDAIALCANSLEVELYEYDILHNIMKLDVTLRNPNGHTGYDVRCIFHTSDDGAELRNPEGWTPWFDTTGGYGMNPFRLLGNGENDGRVGPSESVTERLIIKFFGQPHGQSFTLSVDGSWCDEADPQAHRISNFRSSPIYYDASPWGEVYVDIENWEGVINRVSLDVAAITGDSESLMEPISDTTWYARIKNDVGAVPGLYQVKITADSTANESVRFVMYENVEITYNAGWARTWGGISGSHDPTMYGDRARGCITDNDGNIYVTGMFCETVDFDPSERVVERTSIGGFDIYLSKFSPGGSLLWVNTWGGPDLDFGDSLATDSNGYVYLTGRFLGTLDFDPGEGTEFRTAEAKDVYLCKFNGQGDLLWVNTWGGPGNEYGFGIDVDSSGNVYVTGNFEDTVDFDPGPGVCQLTANNADVYLVKFGPYSNFQWAQSWGGDDWDFAEDVKVSSSGYVYVTGCFGDTVDFRPGSSTDWRTSNGYWDAFLVRFTNTGYYKWTRTWGGEGWDFGNALAIYGSNHIYVTGDFQFEVDFDPAQWTEATVDVGWKLSTYVSGFDYNGNFRWVENLVGAKVDMVDNTPENWYDPGLGIDVDSKGNVYITGWYEGTAQFPEPFGQALPAIGGKDAYIAKFGASGGCLWGFNFGGLDRDEGIGLSVDPWDNIFVSGFFEGTVDFDPGPGVTEYTSRGYDDAFLVKFLPDGTW